MASDKFLVDNIGYKAAVLVAAVKDLNHPPSRDELCKLEALAKSLEALLWRLHEPDTDAEKRDVA